MQLLVHAAAGTITIDHDHVVGFYHDCGDNMTALDAIAIYLART